MAPRPSHVLSSLRRRRAQATVIRPRARSIPSGLPPLTEMVRVAPARTLPPVAVTVTPLDATPAAGAARRGGQRAGDTETECEGAHHRDDAGSKAGSRFEKPTHCTCPRAAAPSRSVHVTRARR